MNINVALAGAGAFGLKHLDALKVIDGARVISLVGRARGKTEGSRRKYGIPHVATDLAESLQMKEVDAVILCTPTPLHATQASRLLCRPASTSRSRSRSATRCPTAWRSPTPRRPAARSRCAATPAGSTPATSGCTSGSVAASFTSSR